MKLKIIVLLALGVAGAGSSYALAAGGGAHDRNAPCRHTVAFGTVSAPQVFTVTVVASPAWGFRRHGDNLAPGKPVQVAMGAAGQTIRFAGVGCVGTDGTLTVSTALLRVDRHQGDGATTTDQTTSTSPSSDTPTPPASTDTTQQSD